ncbi:phosphotransferase [Arcobacter sp. YIC-464]|uniref:phosphotransferase n=1 Tax=Arcobacter sp. YIC-464 TaxID=3376631 RepID=UPI003C213459
MNIQTLKTYKLFKNKKLTSLELLENQGVCNTIYKLKTSNKTYTIRVFKHKHKDKQNRRNEFQIQRKAFKKNIAAQAYKLDEKNGLMICEFLKGNHKEKLLKKDIQKIVKSLKKLHTIKIKDKAYNLKKDFKFYKKTLKDKKLHNIINSSLLELEKLSKYKKDLVLCHHDLNQKNILFNKNKAFFIDWEFSCINDRFFDLAALCIEFKLNSKQEDILLKEYFKKVKKEHKQKLKSYKKICTNLWILWFKALEK